ncbi:MAG: heavy-metal-associated domain-containing protein, partial [Sphingobacteriaceae bacterium]|nr:heavy-metal-associated domain-containing protein [Cytophagaceae bacterium]
MKHQHQYHLHGLTTTDQAGAVKSALLTLPGILDADVTVQPPLATVTVERHPDVKELQRVVSGVGAFHVMEAQAAGSTPHHEPHTPAPEATESKATHPAHPDSHAQPGLTAAPVHDHPAMQEPPAEAQAQQHIAHDSHSGPKDQASSGGHESMSMR